MYKNIQEINTWDHLGAFEEWNYQELDGRVI